MSKIYKFEEAMKELNRKTNIGEAMINHVKLNDYEYDEDYYEYDEEEPFQLGIVTFLGFALTIPAMWLVFSLLITILG